MNYDLLKQKMDKFFSETTSEILVSEFEKMGYTFVNSAVEYKDAKSYIVEICERRHKPSFWEKMLNKNSNDKTQDFKKFEVFFYVKYFSLCKIAI